MSTETQLAEKETKEMSIEEVGILLGSLFEYYVSRFRGDGNPLPELTPEQRADMRRVHAIVEADRKRGVVNQNTCTCGPRDGCYQCVGIAELC